jgi:hypothetical protein
MPQIYPTNKSITPVYRNECGISDTIYVPTVGALCGVKTDLSRIKHLMLISLS